MLTQPFTVYPAIDVLEGRVVRLSQGRRETVTVEGGDPLAAAERFVSEGAAWLHLVDLDGAFSGEPDVGLVSCVASTGALVQVGGGYRTLDAVDAALSAGATRVSVGTAALDPEFLSAAATRFGERLVVAIDGKDGLVTVDGWTRESQLEPAELARRCVDVGVARLLVTSAQRDGTLAGPDTNLLDGVLGVGLPVLAAGGVATLDDVRLLRDRGCEGVVVGSAIWLGRFTFHDAATLAA